ncbi:hypothetical protein WA026_019225 [Henosepilachna vigintioctopunctata]|uniref:Uncharacterized protein n=1 Tax=Henosepilachna vigintioctopunctata TaxID=420089 RepID=A0AAW1V3U9_9CUCU
MMHNKHRNFESIQFLSKKLNASTSVPQNIPNTLHEPFRALDFKMAQGKLKIKSKVPDNVKAKKKSKGSAFTKRNNRPTKAKKKFEDSHKLKQIITKTVNKAVEEDIRAQAGSKPTLSKAQQAVADYHSKKE